MRRLITLNVNDFGKINSCVPQTVYDVHKAINVLSNPCKNMFAFDGKAYPEDDMTETLGYAIYALKKIEEDTSKS